MRLILQNQEENEITVNRYTDQEINIITMGNRGEFIDASAVTMTLKVYSNNDRSVPPVYEEAITGEVWSIPNVTGGAWDVLDYANTYYVFAEVDDAGTISVTFNPSTVTVK